MQHQMEFLHLVEELRPAVKELTVNQVKDMMGTGEKFNLIDVREDYEWQHGSLPNAVHLSKGVIERDIESAIPDKETPIVLFCSGGFRSIVAAYNVQKMGYDKVYSMAGGLKGWMATSFPVVPTNKK